LRRIDPPHPNPLPYGERGKNSCLVAGCPHICGEARDILNFNYSIKSEAKTTKFIAAAAKHAFARPSTGISNISVKNAPRQAPKRSTP